MNETKKHQGSNVRFFRNARNMKQEDFAERLGVKQPTITKIEQQSVIDQSTLVKCAEILGISVEMLRDFEPNRVFECECFTYNSIDKVENSNGTIMISKDSSNTNNNYPIEKLMELNNKNTELYERLIQENKEKIALLEKMIKDKKDNEG